MDTTPLRHFLGEYLATIMLCKRELPHFSCSSSCCHCILGGDKSCPRILCALGRFTRSAVPGNSDPITFASWILVKLPEQSNKLCPSRAGLDLGCNQRGKHHGTVKLPMEFRRHLGQIAVKEALRETVLDLAYSSKFQLKKGFLQWYVSLSSIICSTNLLFS